MPKGIYERKPFTPEHRAAMSKAQKGVPKSPEHNAANSAAHKGVPLSLDHCAAVSRAKKGVPKSPEHCAALSAAHLGVSLSPEHCTAISAGQRNSDAVKTAQDKMRGGNDICDHHYIYDHSDLSKNTVGMARSDHVSLHHLLRKLMYTVPHINMGE